MSHCEIVPPSTNGTTGGQDSSSNGTSTSSNVGNWPSHDNKNAHIPVYTPINVCIIWEKQFLRIFFRDVVRM